MEFCSVCNNKLNLIEENKKLFLICNKCGLKKKIEKVLLLVKHINL